MNITKTTLGDKIILALEGRLDTITSPQLQTELLNAIDEGDYVELDFQQLSYVSSAGLRVLLLGQKKAAAKKGTMVLKHVSPEIMDIFKMTGFAKILKIEA